MKNKNHQNFVWLYLIYCYSILQGSSQVELAPEDAEKVKVSQKDFLSSLDDIKPVSIRES